MIDDLYNNDYRRLRRLDDDLDGVVLVDLGVCIAFCCCSADLLAISAPDLNASIAAFTASWQS